MNIVVIGTGYVGLTQGACLAHFGHSIICVDIDKKKIEDLRLGKVPFYEPGLNDLVKEGIHSGSLTFTSNLEHALCSNPEVIFIAVGTPQSEDGSADLSAVQAVAEDLGRLQTDALIVTKSTVPVGTQKNIKAWSGIDRVASNPEFLREGKAIQDFFKPDRIVLGVDSEDDAQLLKDVYAKIDAPVFVVGPESAELSKYVSNSMLALRLTFMNEIAGLCEDLGADIKDIEAIVGSDKRIGNKFLRTSAGFGGSCFHKDIRALESTVNSIGRSTKFVGPIIDVNERQARVFVDSIEKHLGSIAGLKLAVWGLAFKEDTDDVRESPAIRIIKHLLERGADIAAYDPQAINTAKADLGDLIEYKESMNAAIENSDALLVLTPWQEFLQADWRKVLQELRTNYVFDGKNYLPHDDLHGIGFNVVGVGVWRLQ